jgi:hypothetical protein
MAINFPNSPTVNDTFAVGGINFTFTGVKWESGAVVELSSDTTPTLGGNLDGGAKNIHNVGVITATGFSGPLTGNADTATTATVATDAQGLTGDPSIQVTNATVLGNLDVQGTTSTIDTAITQVDSLSVEGSVGIGTTNPNRLLQVDGASGGNGKVLISTNGAFSGTDTADLSFRVYANPSNGNAHNPQAQIQAVGTGSYDAALTFKTAVGGSDNNTPLERLRITSDGRIGVATDNPNSMGRVSIVVPSTGGHGAINIQNPEVGTGKTNIVFRSLDNNGGNWADAELRAEGYSFKIRTTERFRIDFDGTVSDSMGPLRRLGSNIITTNYTLVAADAGKMVRVDNGSTITIPDNVFSTGDMITIVSGSSSNVPITQGSGLSLYNASDGTTGNKTLAARTVCTILIASGGSSAKAYIAGGGLS